MDVTDLHGQIEVAWKRVYFAVLLIFLTAPSAIIPWLKDMGIISPDNRVFQWLWVNTPVLGQNTTIFGSVFASSKIVWGTLGLFVFGVFYFASKLKHLELLESFRDEAEKRLRVEGYMLKERTLLENKK